MLRQLPDQMVADEHSFFVRFVELFQSLGDELLQHADNIEHLADVSVTPEPLLEWLGSWIGLEGLDPTVPDKLRREFTSQAARGLVWRSTPNGLTDYLSVLAGCTVRVEDSGGVRRVEPDAPWRDRDGPPAVRVIVPDKDALVRPDSGGTAIEPLSGPSRPRVSLDAFIAMVRADIPAHVIAEIVLGAEVVWTSDRDEAW